MPLAAGCPLGMVGSLDTHTPRSREPCNVNLRALPPLLCNALPSCALPMPSASWPSGLRATTRSPLAAGHPLRECPASQRASVPAPPSLSPSLVLQGPFQLAPRSDHASQLT